MHKDEMANKSFLAVMAVFLTGKDAGRQPDIHELIAVAMRTAT